MTTETQRQLIFTAEILDVLREELGGSDREAVATPHIASALGMTERAAFIIWQTMVENARGDLGNAVSGCLILGARIARAQLHNEHFAA